MLENYARHGDYIDIHGWVFTPSSFKLAIQDFNALGYFEMKEVAHFPPAGSEFYYSYEPLLESGATDRLELSKRILDEIVNDRLT